MKSPATVEAYITSFPKEVQAKLRQLRSAILEAVPVRLVMKLVRARLMLNRADR